MNIERLTKKIISLIKKSTTLYLNKEFVELVSKYKFENDDVTNLDVKTQEYIKEKCLKIIPNSNFIAEEGQTINASDYTWILDPIDGTFNLKHNIHIFGTQICLLYKGAPILSVLYLPKTKEVFYANNNGAFCNGKSITVSNEAELSNNVTALGDYCDAADINLEKEISNKLSTNIKRIRMFGSSCFDNCQLASGRIDTYIIYSKSKWDLIPGQYLVQQAGGYVFCPKENIYISGKKENVLKLTKLLDIK